MLRGSCQPGAAPFIEEVFGDCIYNGRDMLGFCCGLLSICCWLVAQLPQLYRNYKSKSADALSPWFLAEWLLGDTFNLLGALLKGDQLPTVVFTAQYFIVVDMVMMVQYIYYHSLQRRRERTAAAAATRRHRPHHLHHHHHRRQQQQQHGGGGSGGVQQRGSSNGSTGEGAHHEHGDQDVEIKVSSSGGGGSGMAKGGSSSSATAAAAAATGGDVSFRPQRVLACLGTLLVVAGVQQQQPAQAAAGQQWQGGPRRLLLADAVRGGANGSSWGFAAHLPHWAYTAGTVLGYGSSLLYLTSRLSQIYKNYKRQSAEGLAISMFLCAIAANTLYGSSILIRSYTAAELRSSLPWLIGSLGTVALDVTIFAQARVLAKDSSQKQHPSDEDEPLLL